MEANGKPKKISWIRWAFVACALVFMVSAGMLVYNKITAEKESNAFTELSTLAAPVQQTEATTAPITQPEAEPEPAAPVPIQYGELYAMNNDFYGWISIEGTNIDYPVMLTPDEPEKYLHTAFDGSYSQSGVPFIGEGYVDGAVNTIVYGHHMKNGSMFAGLLDYADKSFFVLHPTIAFNTRFENRVYEIIAVFRSRVYNTDETGVFRYYQYNDIQTEAEFYEYIDACNAASLYATDVTADWGDTLLTLSTCGYHTENGRFVVVAKLVAPAEDGE